MVFSNSIFLIRFLPAVLLIYFAAPRILRNAILFVASLIFYAWGEPVYVVLMIFSTVVDYTHGILVESNLKKGNRARARYFVIESMVINLALLGFFKYADFLIGNVNALFGSEIPLLHLALPIGISFYTFQTMSYTVDVYRGQAKVQRNIISFGAYVALFPQLIAGPIVQYKTVAEELDSRKENCDLFASGVMKFMCGFGKKVLLANNIGMLWDTVSSMAPGDTSVLAAWLGITAYCFQVYFDFSGYSDMAIGLGKIFGFHFPENFQYPYISKSVREFWRRWHISLSTWFKDYLYIPMGGSRRGNVYLHLFIVFLATGLWHGAAWGFVLWGLWHGMFCILERVGGSLCRRKEYKNEEHDISKYGGENRKQSKGAAFIKSALGHVYTLLVVITGWVLFNLVSVRETLSYLKVMFGITKNSFMAYSPSYYMDGRTTILFVIAVLACGPWKRIFQIKDGFALCLVRRLILLILLALCFVFIITGTYNPFIYFRF